MARVETRNPEHPKTTVELEPGETVALCRCFHSGRFPICDGTHRQHPGTGPAIVSAPPAAGSGSPPDPRP